MLLGTLVQCRPILRPLVQNGSKVYTNQPIMIRCITLGTVTLAWRSDEYIGPGQQLSFNINSMSGETKTSSVGANATFVSMDNTDMGLTLESFLHISVISTFSSFTVTCRNIDLGFEEHFTYQTIRKYCFNLIL